ncbi:hypothetical protein M1O29_02165 [Dehalococcoidia bacterium]|nr:hypothetical protein [Dehalococcoidia bacterium]
MRVEVGEDVTVAVGNTMVDIGVVVAAVIVAVAGGTAETGLGIGVPLGTGTLVAHAWINAANALLESPITAARTRN